jgi:hypothetical protein
LDDEEAAAMSSTQGDAKLFARVSTVHDKFALSVQHLVEPDDFKLLGYVDSSLNYHLHALFSAL